MGTLIGDNIAALLWIGLIFILVWRVIVATKQYIRLRHFKGPSTTGVSKFWQLRAVLGPRTHLDFSEVCDRYGPIARIGPNDLITNDPDLMKRMHAAHSQYVRSNWYDTMKLDPSRDNVLSMRDNNLHAKLRSKMAPGYSGKEVEDMEVKIDQSVLALVDLIEERYIRNNEPFDFGQKAIFFTLDVIAHLAFGEPFGDLASDSDVYDYVQITEQSMPIVVVGTVFPWLLGFLSSGIFRRFLPSDKDVVGLGKAMGIAKKVAAERFGEALKVQRDMLGSFVARGLTQNEAESEILLQVLVGSDTTATAIRSTLLHIITNPRVTNALHAEIDAARPTWPVITDSEARSMPYLQAVIKEGLRMCPPITGLLAKEVPKGGDSFKGYFLPEGTHIGYSIWNMMRREEVWGKDRNEFRPERWLEASPEKLRDMESTWELVFAHGRWQCLGKNVALMELNKVFVELFRRFDLVVVDPTKPWHSVNWGIFLQSQFWIKASRRPI